MTTVAQVGARMQYLLTTKAEELGRETGFIQRARKLDGATFAQMLVFGWMGNPGASLSDLSAAVGNLEVELTRQGVAGRFNAGAARFMWALLQAVLAEVVDGPAVDLGVLQRFNGVYVLDSTSFKLPDELETVWPGCGGRMGTSAGLKVSVLWDLLRGGLTEVELLPGCAHDQQAHAASQTLPAGSLRLADLGYFKLDTLAALSAAGGYWLSPYKRKTALFVEDERLVVEDFLAGVGATPMCYPVNVGMQKRIPARLVAVRVSDAARTRREARLVEWERKQQRQATAQARAALAWDVYLTNVPPELLTAQEVLTVAHVRWQIELLFKLWKSEAHLTQWRTQNPWRILCEIYAKLIAALLQHWLLVQATWALPDRSPTRVFRALRHHAWQLAASLATRTAALVRTLNRILTSLRSCRMNKNKTSPRTFQRLEVLS